MSFVEDGFIVAQALIPKTAIDGIKMHIWNLFMLQAQYTKGLYGNLASDEGIHEAAAWLIRADVQRYIATARETQNLPRVQRMLASRKLCKLAERLGVLFPITSTKPSVHIMADDLAVPGGYHRSPPHQDWRSNQGSLDNLVLWIPLTPVRGNGLEVIRGSHKYGLLPTTDHMQTPEVVDPERLGPWEKIDCDPGDVVAFSSFLVHRTAAGPGLRIAISTRFNNAAEPSYIKRGYPTPYRTTYRLDVPWSPNDDHFPNRPPDRRSDDVRGVPAPESAHIEPGA